MIEDAHKRLGLHQPILFYASQKYNISTNPVYFFFLFFFVEGKRCGSLLTMNRLVYPLRSYKHRAI